jgi:hypothetical protein
MRTLVLLVLLGCAHQQGAPVTAAPATQAPMSDEQVRACESCRHSLQLCTQSRSRADFNASGTRSADCMNDFMSCLNAQQLDSTSCQGMN